MNLTVDEQGSVGIVGVLADRLEASNAETFKHQLTPLAQQHSKLVLNLQQVEFIDSTGCGAIISALKTTRAAGGDLKIAGVCQQPREVFSLIRLHRICDICETPADAVAAFENPPPASA